MQCLPITVSTVMQVTQQSEYIFQVLALSREVAQTYESVEVLGSNAASVKGYNGG